MSGEKGVSQEYPYLSEAGTEHGPIWLLSTERELRTATREEIALWRLLTTAREERDRLRAVVEAAADVNCEYPDLNSSTCDSCSACEVRALALDALEKKG